MKKESKRPYPFNGYAPGNYINDCACCKKEIYNVDKMCFVCLECAINSAKEYVNELKGKVKCVLDDETILEPIQNTLYATGKIPVEGCDIIAEGILKELRSSGMDIYSTEQAPSDAVEFAEWLGTKEAAYHINGKEFLTTSELYKIFKTPK